MGKPDPDPGRPGLLGEFGLPDLSGDRVGLVGSSGSLALQVPGPAGHSALSRVSGSNGSISGAISPPRRTTFCSALSALNVPLLRPRPAAASAMT